MSRAKLISLPVLIATLVPLTITGVQAQTIMKVSAVQAIAEKRSGGGWTQAGSGTLLAVGDGFRTRKRSKADLKYGDGSLLRLGQLCTIEVVSGKSVRLSQGQLLFARLTQGHIVAGSAAATIKGSVGVVKKNDDGSVSFTLYSGAMEIYDLRHAGRVVPLRPGYTATVLLGGIITALRPAAPLAFAGGQLNPEVTTAPSSAPFAGSLANIEVRESPERTSLEQSVAPATAVGNLSPVASPTPGETVTFPEPFPVGPNPLPNPFPTLASKAGQHLASGRLARDDAATLATDDVLVNAATSGDVAAATRHLDQANQANGSSSGGEVDVLAALGDEGIRAYGGRLRAFGTQGHLFADAALLGLRISSNVPGGGRRTTDFSTLSHAFVTYRGNFGDVQLGRQRFLEGPTQASLFGSLVRQSGRDTMDALRFRPRLHNDSVKLDVAYLHDAFPHNLPFRAPGSQHGWYGRAAVQRKAGNFGVNLINYRNLPGLSATGITGDFALPLARDAVELYGEAGRDAARRSLATVGLTFPRLFERTDYDAYLEYAHLGSPGVTGATRLPNELTLRVFRHVTENLNLVVQASRFSATPGVPQDNTFSIGVQFGAVRSSGGGH